MKMRESRAHEVGSIGRLSTHRSVMLPSSAAAAWASAAISSSRTPDPAASASISASSSSLETTLLRAVSRSSLVRGAAGLLLVPDADAGGGGRTVRGVVTDAHSSEDDVVEPKEPLLPSSFDLVLFVTFLKEEEPKNGTLSFMARDGTCDLVGERWN